MNEGWINIYHKLPGSGATLCSCIWPTKEIAEERRGEECFVACIKVQWPVASDLTNAQDEEP